MLHCLEVHQSHVPHLRPHLYVVRQTMACKYWLAQEFLQSVQVVNQSSQMLETVFLRTQKGCVAEPTQVNPSLTVMQAMYNWPEKLLNVRFRREDPGLQAIQEGCDLKLVFTVFATSSYKMFFY